MTETTITAIIVAGLASLPPTLVALRGLVETRKAKVAARVTDATVQETVRQNETLLGKSDQIHALVNSNLTAVKADLEIANRRIMALQNMVDQLVSARDHE